jgi:hypothetical protein
MSTPVSSNLVPAAAELDGGLADDKLELDSVKHFAGSLSMLINVRYRLGIGFVNNLCVSLSSAMPSLSGDKERPKWLALEWLHSEFSGSSHCVMNTNLTCTNDLINDRLWSTVSGMLCLQ